MKPLNKLKNGEKVMEILTRPLFFEELSKATHLDAKKLQQSLARLHKHGYIEKDHRGLWAPKGLKHDSLE